MCVYSLLYLISSVICMHLCVSLAPLPASRGTAGCTACGRCHGAGQWAGSGACGGSGASLGRGRLPPPACGGYGCPPGPTPPNPSAHWRLLPQSTWCCWRKATEPDTKKIIKNPHEFKLWLCHKMLRNVLNHSCACNRTFLCWKEFEKHFHIFPLVLTWVPKPKEPTLSSVIRLFWRNTRCDS